MSLDMPSFRPEGEPERNKESAKGYSESLAGTPLAEILSNDDEGCEAFDLFLSEDIGAGWEYVFSNAGDEQAKEIIDAIKRWHSIDTVFGDANKDPEHRADREEQKRAAVESIRKIVDNL